MADAPMDAAMTPASMLDAYDTLTHSETLLLRLTTAFAELSRKQGLKDEKDWLELAINRVTAAREGLGDLQSRVMRLPEMESAREEHSRSLQSAAVDAVERLQAGITFHAGARAPLLEALYGRLKLPTLRRAERDDFERFCADFEKRLSSGYARRMFGDPALAVVVSAVDQTRSAFAAWRASFTGEPLDEVTARGLRDELDACARRLELPMKQARLLAEAALAPLRDFFESTNIAQRPRRRVMRPAVTELGEVMDEFDESAEAPDSLDAPPPEAEPEPASEAQLGAEPVVEPVGATGVADTAQPEVQPKAPRRRAPRAPPPQPDVE